MNRRTEIKIETRSVTIIYSKEKPRSAFCDQCQAVETVFAPEQLAAMFRVSLAEICRRLDTKQIHLTRSERGTALVCGASLKELQNESKGEEKC